MVPFALRSLLHDRIRLAISVGGVAFSILLILILRGILDGTVARTTVYIDRVGADLFITQRGIEHMSLVGSASAIPRQAEARAQQVPGVAVATGIYRFPTVVMVGEHEVAANLVGFDTSSPVGGPWQMAGGTARLSAGGAIIDRVLARSEGLDLGDTITVAGYPLRVEGLSSDTNVLGGHLIFIRREDAAAVLMAPDVLSFVLVKLEAGADPAAVAAALRAALPEQSVLTRADLAANDRDLLSGLFITPVNVMATIGLIVGLLVIGLTTYSAAAERTRDFGVLKAIGARNRYLYGVIIRQALATGLTGFAAGVGLSLAAGPLIEAIAPDLGIRLQPVYALQTLGFALALSLASAVVPVLRLAHVDPKQVFKT